MSELEYLRLGLRTRGVSIKLKLRPDKSPWTCAAVCKRLPIEGQVWHAKWANNEIYTLLPVRDEIYREEWKCLYPAPGDLMYLPIEPSQARPPHGVSNMDISKGLIDLAYFYDRGSNLTSGPSGAHAGNIFATPIDIPSVEQFTHACADVWFSGAKGELLFLEAATGD